MNIMPKGIRKYDHLPPVEAIVQAWTIKGPQPQYHDFAKNAVARAMPLLARAIERLVKETHDHKP